MLIKTRGRKVVFFVVWAIVGFIGGLIVFVENKNVGAGTLVILPGLLAFAGGRTFLGPEELRGLRRPLSRGTNKASTGYILGALSLIATVYFLPFTISLLTQSYSTYTVRIAPPADYAGDLTRHLLQVGVYGVLAIYYFQSSRRLSKPTILAAVPLARLGPQEARPVAETSPSRTDNESRVLQHHFVLDRLQRGQQTAFRFRHEVARPEILANVLVLIAIATAMVSASEGPRTLSFVAGIGFAALAVLAPALVYLRIARTYSELPARARQTSRFGATKFELTINGDVQKFRYDDFVSIRREGRMVVLTAFNGPSLVLPVELIPADEFAAAGERIAAGENSLAHDRMRAASDRPASFDYHFTIDATAQRRWARAAVTHKLFRQRGHRFELWADVALALVSLLEVVAGHVDKWEWSLVLAAAVVALALRTMGTYIRVLRTTGERLITGAVWNSQFTSTDFWLQTDRRTRRTPYAEIASISRNGASTFLAIVNRTNPIQVPTELFPEERVEWVRSRAAQTAATRAEVAE